jgi:hypothetical protein
MRKLMVLAIVVGIGSWLACNPSPTSPSDLIPPGTHQSAIAAVTGPGRGGVSVTPRSIPEGTMMVGINVLVVDARPNTTYIVQRAADVNRLPAADGICQRATSLPPWSPSDPPAPTFSTFPLGAGAATFTTSTSGTGSLSFDYRSEMIAAGTSFDVMFRLVDNETAPTTELRSGCFPVIVK